MKKVFVTGAAGFIGSHLVDSLLACGYHVVGYDNLVNGKTENLKDALKNSNFHFVHGDIRNVIDLQQALGDAQVVFHLACLGVRHSIHSPYENHEVNAEGSLKVLEAARKANVQKFFYISTSEIYGDISVFPIDELGVPAPKTVYGSSKLAGENYAYSYFKCYNLPVVITRIFNNYGPRAHHEGDAGEMIPRSIVRMLYGEPPVVFGDGSVTRDFFYVKDTARVLTGLMQTEKIEGQIINIGTGIEISMKELAQNLIQAMNLEGKINIHFAEDRPADVPRLWVNPKKFLSLTNFENPMDFQKGLEETISFYKSLSIQKNLIQEIQIENWKE